MALYAFDDFTLEVNKRGRRSGRIWLSSLRSCHGSECLTWWQSPLFVFPLTFIAMD